MLSTSRSCCRQISLTVELVDHTYDSWHVVAVFCTCAFVDRNALSPLFRFVVDLLRNLFLHYSCATVDKISTDILYCVAAPCALAELFCKRALHITMLCHSGIAVKPLEFYRTLCVCKFRQNVRVLPIGNVSSRVLEERGDRGGRSDLRTTSRRKVYRSRRSWSSAWRWRPRISRLPRECIELTACKMFRQEAMWSARPRRRFRKDRAMSKGTEDVSRSPTFLRWRQATHFILTLLLSVYVLSVFGAIPLLSDSDRNVWNAMLGLFIISSFWFTLISSRGRYLHVSQCVRILHSL